MKALALLAVTITLAVLLAVLSHEAWPPVLVAILGTLPALYLAWLAVPGVVSPPEPGAVDKSAHGRLATRWDPVELGVHKVTGGGPMPAYVRRPHDELLRAVLNPAVAASRLVVVRGGSSTGKTRAAYEAVAAQLADWQLDYPLDPSALATRLEEGIPARTVLWLGELRQYADADGGPVVLARLADLLNGEGHLVITTLWPERWVTYTAAARAGPGTADPAGTAGRLLERLPELTGRDPAAIEPARGGVIDVPDRFSAADLEAAVHAGDPVLAEAVTAAADAGHGGEVTQYLAGVPDLLRRYAGRGGDPYGQAVITAAVDATRLGHSSPLPAALLQEAAVGYLAGPLCAEQMATWGDIALAWAAAELNGAVRALQPAAPARGTGTAGYLVADYLDQHARRTRQDQLGPPSLWDALTARAAGASDLTRLGQSARDRGLYRHAAALWTAAAALGSTDAAAKLISHLRQVSPDGMTRAARWAVGRADLDDPLAVAELLRALRAAGADEAVHALLARDPAAHVDPSNPWSVTWLLQELRHAGADGAVTVLSARAADHAGLGNPMTLTALLRELRMARADSAVRTLAARAASQASLGNPLAVATLLLALKEAGADEAVHALLARDPGAHANVSNPRGIASLLRALRQANVGEASRILAARAAGMVSVEEPQAIAELLHALRAVGAKAGGAAATLAARTVGHVSLHDPLAVAELVAALRAVGAIGSTPVLAARAARAAGQVSLDDAQAVANALKTLRAAGADGVVAVLAARAVGQVSLEDPLAVAELLEALRAAGADEAVHVLLARDPATHADPSNPRGIARLLRALHQADSGQAIRTPAARAAGQVSLEDPLAVAELLEALRAAGADEAVHVLLARDPAAHADPSNPRDVAELLHSLRIAGADDAVATLAARAASRVSLKDPLAVAALMGALCGTGPDDASRTLADRAANAGIFRLFLKACPDEASDYPFGREPDGSPSLSWDWQQPTDWDN